MFKLLNVKLCVEVLILLRFADCTVQIVNGRGVDKNLTRIIRNYFPQESNLLVVQSGSCAGSILPKFPLPVVLSTSDNVLQNCNNKKTDYDGYVFISSTNDSLEFQTMPLLQCFSQTTSTLKIKYILVVRLYSRNISKDTDIYISYFQTLWETFGIANVAVLHDQKHILNINQYFEIVIYNPFLAQTHSSLYSLIRNNQPQDARSIMYNRFRNMHSYTLKGVFETDPFQGISHQDLIDETTLGGSPATLFKNVLESILNITIEVYKAPKLPKDVLADRQKSEESVGESSIIEIVNGRADLFIGFQSLTGIKEPDKIDKIHTGIIAQYVFIVPKPKEVDSWKLFQYIFQWSVSVSLGLAVLTLSVLAAFFVRFQPSNHPQSISSEIASVWMAVLSAPLNKLPRSHSQRFLITMALLLGLIIVTVSCAQLFALMKAKPRQHSIKSLLDLQESNLPIHCVIQCITVLYTLKNTSLEKLISNLKIEKENEPEKRELYNASNLNVTDRAVLLPLGMLRFLAATSEGRAFAKHFEMVKEPLLPGILVITLPKGSLYADVVSKINLRLAEGGIFMKWFIASSSEQIKAFSKSKQPARVAEPAHTDVTRMPLKYKDLELAFFVLYMGLSASVICFVLEFLMDTTR